MPKTPDGKLRSSQNSTEHGLRSDHFRVLPGESREEFETLRKSWLDRYQNQEYADSAIVLMAEKLAENDWLVRRGMQAVCNAQQRFAEAELTNQSEEVLDKLERRLLLMTRYKTSLENSKTRTLREIEAILGRRKREELQERMIYMRENALVLNIQKVQATLGIPHSIPWSPAPSQHRAFERERRKQTNH
jgi:hypothetical protein